jgi:hypothetical protein
MTAPSGYRTWMLGFGVDAYHPLNETSGTTAFQQAGVGTWPLTINGSPELASQRAIGNQAQQVMAFDGTDDYCEGSSFSPTSTMTVSAWVWQANVTTARMWIVSMGGASSYSWALYVNASQQLAVDIWQAAGAAYSAVVGPTFIPRRWSHVAFTLAATPQLDLYYDGRPVGRSTSTSGTQGTDATLAIGRRPDNANSKWNGYIGHVGYWTGGTGDALTPTQIHDLYWRGRTLFPRQSSRRLSAAR